MPGYKYGESKGAADRAAATRKATARLQGNLNESARSTRTRTRTAYVHSPEGEVTAEQLRNLLLASPDIPGAATLQWKPGSQGSAVGFLWQEME